MSHVITIILACEWAATAGIAIGLGYYIDELRRKLPVRDRRGRFARRRK